MEPMRARRVTSCHVGRVALDVATGCSLSLSGFELHPEHVRRLSVTWGLGGGVRRAILLVTPC